jgi:hypothetical protein
VNASAGTVPAAPVKVSAGTVPPLPVNAGTPAGQLTVSADVVLLDPEKDGTAAGQLSAPSVNAPPLIAPSANAPPVIAPSENAPPLAVGTPLAGHESAPSANDPPLIAPSVNAPPLAIGTLEPPVGHAIVPVGVKLTVPLVPLGVIVCEWAASWLPVKTSAGMVMDGELEAAAALLSVENTYFVGLVTGTSVEADVIDWAAFVPAGVPAVTELVASLLVPVKVSAGTVPELPANVGTGLGQAIVGWVKVPAAIVGCVKTPAAMVGTFPGHAIVGWVKVPAAIVGCVKTPAAMVG